MVKPRPGVLEPMDVPVCEHFADVLTPGARMCKAPVTHRIDVTTTENGTTTTRQHWTCSECLPEELARQNGYQHTGRNHDLLLGGDGAGFPQPAVFRVEVLPHKYSASYGETRYVIKETRVPNVAQPTLF